MEVFKREVDTISGHGGGLIIPDTGPTLLDQFAMAALTGFCSMCDSTGLWQWTPDLAADKAYQVAQAMMKAREVHS